MSIRKRTLGVVGMGLFVGFLLITVAFLLGPSSEVGVWMLGALVGIFIGRLSVRPRDTYT